MIRFVRCIRARLTPMVVNQFLMGSLTGVFLVNGVPMPAPTLSDRAHWIAPVGETAASQNPIPQSLGPTPAPSADWQARLAANARHLSMLSAGWDGPGSIPISPTLLSRAMFYVESALN